MTELMLIGFCGMILAWALIQIVPAPSEGTLDAASGALALLFVAGLVAVLWAGGGVLR